MKSSKDTALLLNPLQRIAAVAEANSTFVSQIHAVLTVDLKKAAVETHKELKKQTAILGDIRELIKELKDKEKGGKGGVKMPSMAGAVAGGFVIAFSQIMVTYAYKKFLIYLLPTSLEPTGLVQLLSTDYKFAVSFSILVIVLLVRPAGIFRGRTL